MSELPEKIVGIDILRINRNATKLCQCQPPHFEVDTTNRLVRCTDCGAIVDPFEALTILASNYSRASDQVEHLLEQRRQIDEYKPHLVVIKRLEEMYRGQRMVPTCPECQKPIDLADLPGVVWVNRAFLPSKD